MDNGTLARLMLKTAKREIFNGQARIVINDFLKEQNLKLTIPELLAVFRQNYPYFPIQQKMNVFIIDLGVKP